ncbi:uncharacterized protein EV154DRAFT_527982 [Mucor mucedo]|uniref:uncharacterized protein n=1 Tax=Mucor mucedo TaxID=29922 RepID=UPI0022210DEB|nr:uncharacterized protein EV154DRAFT_527982 [Mucor mucedo]KAI7873520.1 hypothetical protein EV154DRAFT_527982 [Mucor mucedo]
MPTSYITNRLEAIVESTTRRHIYFDEIIELGELINTKTQLLLALKMTFNLSKKCSSIELGNEWQDRMSDEKSDCEDLIMNYSRLIQIWTELAPIIESNVNIHRVLNHIKQSVKYNLDNVDETSTALVILRDEIYYVNSKRFRIFLGRNQLRLLDPLFGNWEIMPIEIEPQNEDSCIHETRPYLMTSKAIQRMIENTSKTIFGLRAEINVETIR